MIELHGITKTYRANTEDRLVLNHVSGVFPPRTAVGILGPNGAGKSTLLRIIGGAELPDEGKVVRHGRVSWPIGFGGAFSPSLNAVENCHFVARIYGAEVDEVTAYAQEFADIGDYFYMPIRTYSSGMAARLAFGLSMALDFDIYLVDEVIAVGDAPFQERCQLAFQERLDHSTMIMVSHATATIEKTCNLFAVLDQGRLEFFDDFNEAEAKYQAASQ